MQLEANVPDYLSSDFSMYLENMTSYDDPENPDLLTNYLSSLFEQLKKMPSLFNGMVDQLAMAISTKVRIDSENLAKVVFTKEPTWAEIKPFVGVHADARACITEIMNHSERDLKNAVLLIHFYNRYDATPLNAESDENEQDQDYDSVSFFENDNY